MNDETLERLLMDRACGELSEDVGELLEAYLTTRPPVANEIADTIALARRAMQPAKLVALPKLKIVNASKETRSFPLWALGMAACFVAGLAVIFFSRERHPAALPQQASVSARQVQVIWESPVRRPVIKAKL